MTLTSFQQAATTYREKSLSNMRTKLERSEFYKPISEEEYEALKIRQFCELDQRAQEAYKPDLSKIGLHETELSLNWTQVQPGISDGVKARDAVRPVYERGCGIVFLWGNYGQAKTLVGKILTATAFRDGKRAAYANVSDVLDNIRLAFDEKENKTTDLLRRIDFWVSRDVLFLDELDKANGTDWAESTLFTLLDRRYARAVREEAVTVIASNKAVDALDGYLKSRITDRRVGQVVYLSGPDGRQSVPDGWRF